MLDLLRRGASTLPAKLLLGALTLSFVAWGVTSRSLSGADSSVATVGRQTISAQQFQASYRRQLQNYEQRTGKALSSEDAQTVGLPQMVLNQLVSQAAIGELARQLDLGLSDDALAAAIRRDPLFRGAGGAFDPHSFQTYLREIGASEKTFADDRRSMEMRVQIGDGAINGMPLPAALDKAYFIARNEQRSIDYVVVPPSAAGTIGEPSAETLKSYFDTHKDFYRLPEFRKVSYVTATPETIADPAAVSEADARAEYDRTRSAYGTPETRHLRQLMLPDSAREKVIAALNAGKTLDEAAGSAGLGTAIADLGTVQKAEIADPKVADIAFSTPNGKVSGVVDGQFGPSVVEVAGVTTADIKPFEAVEAAIREKIAADRAGRQVMVLYDKIEEARSGGMTLAEISTKFKLPLTTIDAVSLSRRDPDGKPVTTLPQGVDLIGPLFKAEVGQQTDALQLGRTGFIWFDVAAVIAPRERALTEVRERVLSDWKDNETVLRLDARAAAIRDSLNTGKDFATAAPGLDVAHADALTRVTQPKDAITDGVIRAAFSVARGQATTTPGTGGGRVVLVVRTVVDPPYVAGAGLTDEDGKQVLSGFRNDMIAALVDAERTAIGTSYNPTLMNQITGANGN